MGKACSTQGIDNKILSENVNIKTTSAIQSEMGNSVGITVIYTVSEGVNWMDLCGSQQGWMKERCEQSNDISGTTKGVTFFE